MNRRDFIRSAGAAAVIPVLPLPAMAAPAAVVPANAFQVGWAALYARVNSQATPELIQKWLRVGPEQAHQIMGELVTQNIVKAPVAGSAVAVKPMYPNGGVPGVFKRARSLADLAKDTLDALQDDDSPLPATDPGLHRETDALENHVPTSDSATGAARPHPPSD